MGGFRVLSRTSDSFALRQRGLNMVDAMIWLIIGALISTFAIQSMQMYRTAAIVYQMKSDLKGAADLALSRAVLTGFVTENEVSYSVDNSQKSDGVSMSWGKFQVQDDNPNQVYEGETQSAQAYSGDSAFELVSSTSEAAIELASDGAHDSHTYTTAEGVTVDKTFVLVAHHDEAPSIKVMYFFGDIFVYHEGAQEFPSDALPPIQDMPTTTPDEETTPSPSPTTDPAPDPAPEPEPEPEPTATEVPVTAPEQVPTPAPTPTPTPSSSPTTTPSESPSPPKDPTPEPNPLTPADNMNPKTKDYLFCHNGMMHSNSFQGMVQGHEHHADDIMPPIPPRNYPGHNWNHYTAKIYYNNCQPVG